MRWMVPKSGVLVVALALVWGCGETQAPSPAPKSDAPASKAAAAGTDAPVSAATTAPATKAAPATRAAAVTVASVDIDYALTPAESDARQALALKILDGKLKGLALRNRKNAVIFRDLAAKHPHPRVVAGALSAMGRTFSTRKGAGAQVDADYRKVVRVRMGATNPTIKVAAIDAARLLLGSEPELATLDAVIKTALDVEPIGRAAAVRTLVSLPFMQAGDTKSPFYGKVMLSLIGVKHDDTTRAIMLERLSRTLSSKHPNAEAFAAMALSHRTSTDPGVRGGGNLTLATTTQDKAAAAKLLMADLKHTNAYVRGASLEGLGRLGYAPAVHAIMALLDDTAQAAHRVDMTPDPLPLRLEYGRTVQAVALGALRELSKASKTKFDYKRSDLRKDPAAIVASAKAWYAKAGIPKP